MIDLFNVGEGYIFRLNNLLLILAIIAFFYFGYIYIRKHLRNLSGKKEVTINGKEITLNALTMQAITIISFFLIVASLGVGNQSFSMSDFLNYELLSQHNGKGLRLSIGQIVGVGAIIFATRVVINILKIFLYRSFKSKHWIDDSRKFTIIQLSRYIIYTIALIVMLKILIGNITNFLIGASALFVGLGLGLQEFFTDLVSGFILLVDGSVKVGDIIELNNEISRVEKINIRTSHVKTTEGKTMIVPNSKLTEDLVTNWSISDKITRFHVDVSVAYGTDTEKVKSLLYSAALNHQLVDKNNEIVVMFKNFGDNGLEFQLYFWAQRTWEILIIKSELRFTIDRLFRENKITIPFPQRDLHIKTKDGKMSFDSDKNH